MEPNDEVRPPDHVQNVRLMDDMPFHEPIEEDPELEFAIAMSIASYEESIHLYNQIVENESTEKKAEQILQKKKAEEEHRKEVEREKRRQYKESLRIHFQLILSISQKWHRVPDMKTKAVFIDQMVNRYYDESGVYLYISEEEYHTFYDILKEMQDPCKIRNPLKEEDYLKMEEHIRLRE
jgi:hypothetical protein